MSNGMPNSSTRPEFKERRENVTLQKSIQFAPKHLASFLSRSSGNQGFVRSARQIPDQKKRSKGMKPGECVWLLGKCGKSTPRAGLDLGVCSFAPFMFNSPRQQLLGLPKRLWEGPYRIRPMGAQADLGHTLHYPKGKKKRVWKSSDN